VHGNRCPTNDNLISVLKVASWKVPSGSVFGQFVRRATAVFDAVDGRPVQASQISDPRVWRVHFQEEMVPRDITILGKTRMAVSMTAEQKRIMTVESKDLALDRPGSHFEFHCCRHG
jgi:hypothetical protein